MDYGIEFVLSLANGNTLRTDTFDANPAGASYVRVCDAAGTEVAYWTAQEWADDPELVMGAIFGAAGGR